MGYNIIFTLISAVIFAIGVFIFLKPASAIKLQIKFYEKINWRIEPVNMRKEVRNTRLMGLFMMILAILILAQYLV